MNAHVQQARTSRNAATRETVTVLTITSARVDESAFRGAASVADGAAAGVARAAQGLGCEAVGVPTPQPLDGRGVGAVRRSARPGAEQQDRGQAIGGGRGPLGD